MNRTLALSRNFLVFRLGIRQLSASAKRNQKGRLMLRFLMDLARRTMRRTPEIKAAPEKEKAMQEMEPAAPEQKVYFASLKEFRRSVLDRYAVFPCKVLEVGAFTAPTVDPSEGDVRFLDCYSTAELVQQVEARGEDPRGVVDVHYVCRDDNYAAVVSDTFDVIIANHVFEHIDRPIEWLQMTRGMLRDGGLLFVVLPDKKYSFDKFRPDTPLSHILFEYLAEGQDVSSIHHFETALYYDLQYIKQTNDPAQKLHLDYLKRAISPSHPGVHRHVFQAETFEDRLMRPLLFTGLIDFDLVEVEMYKPFGEFAVVFRAGAKDENRSVGNLFQPAVDTVVS